MNRTTALTSALISTWALVACGGGSNDTTVAAAPEAAASTPASIPAPVPAASSPDTAASAPEPAASTPSPAASSPAPAASAPAPAASAPAPAASAPAPAPPPAPAPAGQDATYSDKTTFTREELNYCPTTANAPLDLDSAHACLTGVFFGVQSDPVTGALKTGIGSPYPCDIAITAPLSPYLKNGLNFYLSTKSPPSDKYPAGEPLDNHVYLSPTALHNSGELDGFTITQNNYSRATEANGEDVIRMAFSGNGINDRAPGDPGYDQYETTGVVTNAFFLTARKAPGAATWRVHMVIHDSYSGPAGVSCVSTVYK